MAGKGSHGMLFRELPPEQLAGLRLKVGLKEWDEEEHGREGKDQADDKLDDNKSEGKDGVDVAVEVVAEAKADPTAEKDDDANTAKSL